MKDNLRKINDCDLEVLFNWRNHPNTRKNSLNKNKLLWDEHKTWFNKTIKSDFTHTYVLEINSVSVGVIRFDIENERTAKINYLVDPIQQGKGVGTKILESGVHRVFNDIDVLEKVFGVVLKTNLASIRIFEKLSFIKVSESTSELRYEKYK